jgi:hypothetical protein
MAELLYEPTAAEVEAYRHVRGRKPWTTNKKPERSRPWPGPFVSRRDAASSLRPAVWLNCAFCGGLFARSVSKVKSTGRYRKLGAPGNMVCSLSCAQRARYPQPRLVRYFVCKLCGQKFLRPPADRHKPKYCSPACYRQAMHEHTTTRHRHPLLVYAFERGIEPSYEALTCDLCGAAQARKGRSATRWKVRITRVNGEYIAWCAACYAHQAQAEKRKLAAMTPAERLRYTQAKELIKELI